MFRINSHVELAELRVHLGYGYTVKLNLKLCSQDPYLSKAMPNNIPSKSFQKTDGRTTRSGV